MLMGLMPAYRGGERPAWSLKEIVIAPATPPAGWTRTRAPSCSTTARPASSGRS